MSRRSSGAGIWLCEDWRLSALLLHDVRHRERMCLPPLTLVLLLLPIRGEGWSSETLVLKSRQALRLTPNSITAKFSHMIAVLEISHNAEVSLCCYHLSCSPGWLRDDDEMTMLAGCRLEVPLSVSLSSLVCLIILSAHALVSPCTSSSNSPVPHQEALRLGGEIEEMLESSLEIYPALRWDAALLPIEFALVWSRTKASQNEYLAAVSGFFEVCIGMAESRM